ncbi:MAG: ATPase [Bdellovibrionaceae bacterium]|nr:ATPase [Pseudobdellovibrionaceae bacterium]
MGKKRILSSKIKELSKMFPVVAVVGPRQCGKSTLVQQTFPDWKYYDLEDQDHFQLISSNPKNFFELHPEKIIIDEAQIFPELFRTLRSVIDKKRSLKGRFILTGSSSPDIVKGLNESLAGRISTVEMWPFKVNEYIEKTSSPFYEMIFDPKKNKDDFGSIKSISTLSDTYQCWFKGGFPEPLIQSETNPLFLNQWYQSYVASYIQRDIRALFPRLNIQSFQRFLTSLAHFSGHQVNVNSIASALEVSHTTVRDYLDIIHQTFVWRNLPSFEKNKLKKVQKAPRGFFRDQGILHHLLKIQTLDDLLIHPVAGFSFESFVVEEIIRGVQGTMCTQVDFSYYRTIDKSEIDLIIDSPSGFVPIEIKLGSTVKPKQLIGLKNFLKDTKSRYGFWINTSDRVELLAENIIQIPVTHL